jgi:hypothetical protein
MRVSKCLKIVIVYNVYRIVVNIDVCMESALREFNVPPICLGTEGVSPHREGRYILLKLFLELRVKVLSLIFILPHSNGLNSVYR